MNSERHDLTPLEEWMGRRLESEAPESTRQRFHERQEAFLRGIRGRAGRAKLWGLRYLVRRPLTWAGAAGIAAACVVAIIVLGRVADNRVYAQAVEALKTVRTVHLTGWTTELHPFYNTDNDEKPAEGTRYSVDIWEWFPDSGGYRRYEHQGPLVRTDDGERECEYREDANRLYVRKSSGIPMTGKFRSIMDGWIAKEGLISLGEKTLDGHQAVGFRKEYGHGDSFKDSWFDKTSHLFLGGTMGTKQGSGFATKCEMTVEYDVPVPGKVASFAPPESVKKVFATDIDPCFEAWHLHLQRLALYCQDHPSTRTMILIPRTTREKIDSFAPGTLPGIGEKTGQWAYPLQMTLGDYLREEMKPASRLRLPDEIKAIALNHDLITSGTSPRARVDFVLDALGLRLAEVSEPRTVWVAHYDGRRLKPWKDVPAPVASKVGEPLRPGTSGGSGPASMADLFGQFDWYQSMDLSGRSVCIVDETGLPVHPDLPVYSPSEIERWAVANVNVYWGGPESLPIARRWFAEQFGVTFVEEVRPMPLYEVRKK